MSRNLKQRERYVEQGGQIDRDDHRAVLRITSGAKRAVFEARIAPLRVFTSGMNFVGKHKMIMILL